jgi:acyl-coenzyme A synthetase/AMP-(fatty) acid ligase
MPLSTEIASRTEQLANAVVIEIYGSTETGALATRRTTTEYDWSLMQGVSLATQNNESLATGLHFNSPQILNDVIERTASNRFRLVGRNTDLIKVAGRRTSLSGLNLILQNLDGLEDGAFYLPSTGNPDERLSLIYISKSLNYEQIKTYLAERIDSTFIPRALIKVDELPRTESGKVSARSLAKIYDDWSEKRVAHA